MDRRKLEDNAMKNHQADTRTEEKAKVVLLKQNDELYRKISWEQDNPPFPKEERKNVTQLLNLTVSEAEEWLAYIMQRKSELASPDNKVLEEKIRSVVYPLIEEAIRSHSSQIPSTKAGKRRLFLGNRRWGTAAVVLLAVFIVIAAGALAPFVQKGATATSVRQQGLGSTVDPDTAKVFRMAEEAKMFYQN